jgi:hypothetical protein
MIYRSRTFGLLHPRSVPTIHAGTASFDLGRRSAMLASYDYAAHATPLGVSPVAFPSRSEPTTRVVEPLEGGSSRRPAAEDRFEARFFDPPRAALELVNKSARQFEEMVASEARARSAAAAADPTARSNAINLPTFHGVDPTVAQAVEPPADAASRGFDAGSGGVDASIGGGLDTYA